MGVFRVLLLFAVLFGVVSVDTLNILLSNDDGWAEANLRALYASLTLAGHNVILSAPVYDQSGRGSLDLPPGPFNREGQYGSVPIGAPGVGSNVSDPRLNYVNSFPVTAVKYGISDISPLFFGEYVLPDIVLTGPNVGPNLGHQTMMSGTVAAAAEAVKQGIPAIAFSGFDGVHRSYEELMDGDVSLIYAELAMRLLDALTASRDLYLLKGIGLNVNFPPLYSRGCFKPSLFKYVLSRMGVYSYPGKMDVFTCKSYRLPKEADVIALKDECKVSISVFDGKTKMDAGKLAQTIVLERLGKFLDCF